MPPTSPSSPAQNVVPDAEAAEGPELAILEEISAFRGSPAEFWPLYLASACEVLDAETGVLLRLERTQISRWGLVTAWPSSPAAEAGDLLPVDQPKVQRFAADCLEHGGARQKATPGAPQRIALRLGRDERQRELVGLFLVPPTFGQGDSQLRWLRLLNDIAPWRHLIEGKSEEGGQLTNVLDVALLLNEETQHLPSVMLFCNELAARYQADRVALGWARGRDIVHLVALSHTNKINRKLGLSRSLELVMQEAFDQDTEVAWPEVEPSLAVTREHEIFAKAQGSGQIVSLPLRLGTGLRGVITLERNNPRFRNVEISGLRLVADIAVRRLDDLDRMGRGVIRRWGHRTSRFLGKLIGPKHTLAKVAVFGSAALIAFLCLYKFPYRIEAPFTLKPDRVVSIPAPFDGYLEKVAVRPGDAVKEKQALANLDPAELRLQIAEQLATQRRYESEAAVAQGADRITDMRVAQAQAEQASFRINQLNENLKRAELLSPFEGFVVEGDLRERIGAPVKKGDVLLKVSKLDGVYAQVEIHEREIHEVHVGGTGELAFASRPELRFKFTIERIEPLAQPRKEGNFFSARCKLEEAPSDWWRPGMSGLAKIDAGQRPLIYKITYRLINFLRLKLWI